MPAEQSLPYAPLPADPAPTIMFSVWAACPLRTVHTSGITHRVACCVWLPAEHRVFKVRPHGSVRQCSFLFYG